MAGGGNGRRFSWWAGEAEKGPRGELAHPERYLINESSREAAIRVARDEFGAGATIAIVEATQDGPFTTDIFGEDGTLLDDIFEDFAEANDHRFGEDGFDGDLPRNDVAAALNAAFAAVVARFAGSIRTFVFTEQRNKEIIFPEFTDHAAGHAPQASSRAGEGAGSGPAGVSSPDRVTG